MAEVRTNPEKFNKLKEKVTNLEEFKQYYDTGRKMCDNYPKDAILYFTKAKEIANKISEITVKYRAKQAKQDAQDAQDNLLAIEERKLLFNDCAQEVKRLIASRDINDTIKAWRILKGEEKFGLSSDKKMPADLSNSETDKVNTLESKCIEKIRSLSFELMKEEKFAAAKKYFEFWLSTVNDKESRIITSLIEVAECLNSFDSVSNRCEQGILAFKEADEENIRTEYYNELKNMLSKYEKPASAKKIEKAQLHDSVDSENAHYSKISTAEIDRLEKQLGEEYPLFETALLVWNDEESVNDVDEIHNNLIDGLKGLKECDAGNLLNEKTKTNCITKLNRFLLKADELYETISALTSDGKDKYHWTGNFSKTTNESSKARFIFYYFISKKYIEKEYYDNAQINLELLYKRYRLLPTMNSILEIKIALLKEQTQHLPPVY